MTQTLPNGVVVTSCKVTPPSPMERNVVVFLIGSYRITGGKIVGWTTDAVWTLVTRYARQIALMVPAKAR